ncbi:MAG: permease [Myxococcales bacterium]|nr:permease [Myxococcales bacterium]
MTEVGSLHLAVVVAVAFAAGLVDAMAGGGGILTVPAIASFGLPVGAIMGSNKLVGTSGSTIATLRFLLRGKIDLPVALLGGGLAAIGAVLGALALLALGKFDDRIARSLLGLLLIAMALYMFLRRSLGGASAYAGPTGRNLAITAATGLGLGFYDGFFGPGTGSFLVFVMVRFLKFDFVVGTGNAKFLNFASNVASLITYLASGLVVWKIALPMGVANAAGAWVGASLAITGGARFVRFVFLAVAVAIAGRMLSVLLAG